MKVIRGELGHALSACRRATELRCFNSHFLPAKNTELSLELITFAKKIPSTTVFLALKGITVKALS